MKRLIMLAALPALLLAGCAAQSAASGMETLTVTGSYPLQYAQQFTIDECEGGYYLIIIDGTRYLVVPEGENAPAELDADITVLQQPIENIYLVSSSAMDPIISIDGLDTVALSGTQADNWYLDAAKTAMKNGQIAYAGKYSAPDYETILAANCGLAIENTMIYHTPEVKEQLEKFGVPVLVERTGIPAAEKVHSVTKAQRRRLLEVLKCLRIDIQGPRPVEEAIVTSGGIKVSEINPTTLESKKAPGVYFAGEVLDVDAYTGGFNLQIAWSTGHAAGEAAAQDIGGINP